MQFFNMLFLKILEMSLTAGIVIVIVLLVRLLLRELPKNYAYLLWIAVAFRLVVPFSAGSDISIFNLLVWENISSESRTGNGADNSVENDIGNDIDNGVITRQDADSRYSADKEYKTGTDGWAESDGDIQNNGMYPVNDAQSMQDAGAASNQTSGIMAFVWLAGIVILASGAAISQMRLRRKIQYGIQLYDNVYECDQIRSPFVTGMIRPKIYLPFRLSETERQCILAHERYHIKRRDYLIKPFACVLVMVYWFQPLVWIAYHVMSVDMEMSCDEKIISKFTVEMRKEYSRLLLAFATNKRQRPVSPLAFGEENTMKRIKNILHYKQAARWKLAGGAVAIVLTMAACATDASTDKTIAPVSDKAVAAQDNLTTADDQLESRIQNNTDNVLANDSANNGAAVTTTDGTSAVIHHPEQHRTGETSQKTQHHAMEQHQVVEHHLALWAGNSMLDMELCSLDYADADKIVFHISGGLFQYSLQEQKITRSIDLKALNCQEVQTGGKCRIAIYQNSESNLMAVIAPYPYLDADSYIYDLESDELFAYDDGLLERYTLFDGLVSKYDLPEEDRLTGWMHAEHILPLGEHSYGVLRWDSIELTTVYYEAEGHRWELFHTEQATLPKLIKQDDSFYQSASLYAGKDIDQCVLDYSALYNMHDYAGVCALSTGLAYSDEMQQEFRGYPYLLSGGEEVSHSEDETAYLFQFYCGGDYGTGEKVYVHFRYIDGTGWRAEDFPYIPASE